ncbi:MAG: thermonuclease family protein [Anaerolineae bacterium]|nr:thermonuclease family protein [Anaerolineae bacterium]
MSVVVGVVCGTLALAVSLCGLCAALIRERPSAARGARTATVVRATPRPTALPLPTAIPSPTPTRARPTPTASAAATSTREPTPSATPRPTPTEDLRVAARVSRVVDGDTIRVIIEGREYPLRYIGVDSPEPDEPLGLDAAAANRSLLEGEEVVLEKDVSEADSYGRLLRYVWVGDLMVNAEMVRLGYARAAAYPPDLRYQELFEQLEAEARQAQRGLWAPQPTATAPPPGGREGCDPSYPDVCIPPPPPDLDCPEIPYRRFRVLPPDPHRFDRDGDGIGCES